MFNKTYKLQILLLLRTTCETIFLCRAHLLKIFDFEFSTNKMRSLRRFEKSRMYS